MRENEHLQDLRSRKLSVIYVDLDHLKDCRSYLLLKENKDEGHSLDIS
jgi:hypothetical protein